MKRKGKLHFLFDLEGLGPLPTYSWGIKTS